MKKKIFLLITLFFSLFIYTLGVKAEEEKEARLTCVYDKSGSTNGKSDDYVMLKLYNDNTFDVFSGKQLTSELTNINFLTDVRWVKLSNVWMAFGDNWNNYINEIGEKFGFDSGTVAGIKKQVKGFKDDGSDVTNLSDVTSCYPKVTSFGFYVDNCDNENSCHSFLDNPEPKIIFHNTTDQNATFHFTPSYSDSRTGGGEFYFFDHKLISEPDFEGEPVVESGWVTGNLTDAEKEELEEKIGNPWKNKWKAKCVYEYFDIYYNDSDFLFSVRYGYQVNFKFSYDDFINTNKGRCPTLFRLYDTGNHDQMGTAYIAYVKEVEVPFNQCFQAYRFEALYADGSIDEGDNDDINSCMDLIGPDVYDKINEYFGILRIVIPILLIGYGIYDFTKAVFSKEEDMKKARTTFIMRIVAAVGFFLLPMFIKLILNIANSVWDYINPETCVR